MRVTTDSKHYENMAAKIREKTGTDATYKPSEMPSGVDAVYKAGQSSMVDESKLIPKTVSGSYISVDDVSEIPHSVGCKVESVNLCPEVVYSGYYFDSVPNASRAHSKYIRIAPFTVEPSTTYTFSSNLMLYTIWFCNANGEGVSRLPWKKVYTRTFTTPENCTELRITIINTSGTADTTAFEYAILNLGTEALPYIPYVSPKSVRVTRTEANIIPYPWEHSTLTLNGVSFTDNRDGTLTINGTSTSAFPYMLLLDKDIVIGGTLIYSNNANKPLSNITMCVVRKDYNDMIMWKSNESGTPKTLENFTVKAILLQIDKGAVFDNVTIKPILGAGQTLISNADGTVEGMTSVSPYMNIFADTEGVNIEATYNKSYGMQTEYDRFWDYYQRNGTRRLYIYTFAYAWGDDCYDPKYPIDTTGQYCNYLFAYANITDTKVDIIVPSDVTASVSVFSGATKMATIRKLVVSEKTTFTGWFSNCEALKNISFEGVIGNSINFQWCPLTKASITNIINTLSSTVTGQTLTLKLSAVNTAFETSAGAGDGSTSAEFAALVATKTNWTITMI